MNDDYNPASDLESPTKYARKASPDVSTDIPSEDEQDLKTHVVYPKGAKAIDIEDGAKPVVSFQYSWIGVRSEFSPGGFTVEFKDMETLWRVSVKGRALRDIFNRLNDHCIRRIRRLDRDFADDGKPFITGIQIEKVEEES